MRTMTMIIAAGLVLTLIIGTAFAYQEFYGTIESMPANGQLGQWVISGKTVEVVKDTELDQDDGPFAVGSYVEVEGVEVDGKFIAHEIETKKKK